MSRRVLLPECRSRRNRRGPHSRHRRRASGDAIRQPPSSADAQRCTWIDLSAPQPLPRPAARPSPQAQRTLRHLHPHAFRSAPPSASRRGSEGPRHLACAATHRLHRRPVERAARDRDGPRGAGRDRSNSCRHPAFVALVLFRQLHVRIDGTPRVRVIGSGQPDVVRQPCQRRGPIHTFSERLQ
jgi:hypothetical protein